LRLYSSRGDLVTLTGPVLEPRAYISAVYSDKDHRRIRPRLDTMAYAVTSIHGGAEIAGLDNGGKMLSLKRENTVN